MKPDPDDIVRLQTQATDLIHRINEARVSGDADAIRTLINKAEVLACVVLSTFPLEK